MSDEEYIFIAVLAIVIIGCAIVIAWIVERSADNLASAIWKAIHPEDES